ncbi:MAG: flavodoxin family protein [Methanomicrobiales archaeon]|nr:flavodoxin family protein [Methanomicrobiales archaeon]
MKILGLHCSPRGTASRTRRLVAAVLAGAGKAGAETELIDAADLSIVPCTACDACTLTGSCVHDDDVPLLLERLQGADGIVWGSPVYVDNVSGQCKILIDRLADAMHYQLLFGKYGCAVATTHTSGAGAVTAYLNHVLGYLGVVAIGEVHAALGDGAPALEEAEDAAASLGAALAAAIATHAPYPEKEAIIADNRAFFSRIVVENRDWRPGAYEEWVARGWIDGTADGDDPHR